MAWGAAAGVVAVQVLLGSCVAPPAGEGELESLEDPVIYGADDRREYFVLGEADRALADSTVAVLDSSDVTALPGGAWAIDVSRSYASAYSLCSSEPFRSQPTVARCSGVQVGPDLVATAGHCITSSNCATTRFVFGFRMIDSGTVRSTVPANDVYSCAQVVARTQTTTNDFAVVRVDRTISGHQPVAVRRSGTVSLGAPLVVAGHPAGIPLKAAGGATVKDDSHADYFASNLDTYGGNSGSPVVNANTRELEGLLVRGNTDFVHQSGCYVSKRCADSGCPTWEEVTRTSRFLAWIPAAPGCTSDAQCSDGDACNGLETCLSGACRAGSAVQCADADSCTRDACVSLDASTWQCTHSPVACSSRSDGCCPAGCAGSDPDCGPVACTPAGGSCTANGDCCSGRCHVKRRVCR